MKNLKNNFIMIAAGGSGGHLFSASAISSELTKRGYRVILLTDKRVKNLIIDFPAEKIVFIPSDTFTNKSLYKWPFVLGKLFLGFILSFFWAFKTRTQLSIGFGGYPSVAPLLAFKICGSKILIHEQNSIFGRANKFLSLFADGITMGFENTKILSKMTNKKIHFYGNPVREKILYYKNSKKVINTRNITLLVFGGSQGASFLSSIIPNVINELPEEIIKNINIIQQARKEDIGKLENFYSDNNLRYQVKEFFYNFPEIINDSDLVISRSGASTISEMAIMGKACIFVPLPSTLDGDQESNAKILESSDAAIVYYQDQLKPSILAKRIEELVSFPEKLYELSENIKKFGNEGASLKLVNFSESLMSK